MEDLNNIYFFASVVQHGGFSAAARTIGVEQSRLSRRVAALEKRLGLRLLQRTTRSLALTEVGQRFFEQCTATLEGARVAFDSVAELRGQPKDLVRLSSPTLLAQRCLAHVLPGYMTAHPETSILVEATDRTVSVIEERFDIAIRIKPLMLDTAGLEAIPLGSFQRVLVASPAFLRCHGRPESPYDLPKFDTVASPDDKFDGRAQWTLASMDDRIQHIALTPRLVTTDCRVRLQAAIHGIGIALLPEQIVCGPLRKGLVERTLPEWSASKNILHLVFSAQRGARPSIRNVIDYLLIHVPAWLQAISV